MARLIELIETAELRGDGKEGNPFRRCPQLWTKDGRLVAQFDPHTCDAIYTPFAPADIGNPIHERAKGGG